MMEQSNQFPLISIIICTRNRAALLGECIEGFSSQEYPNSQYEIVVIDDGSSDETPEVVRSLQSSAPLPVIRYVPQSHQGLNAARNAGIRNARGAVVLFFDDDQIAPPGFLEKVSALLAENPDIDGVGGPVKDYGKSGLRTCNRCSLGDADVPGTGKRLVPYLLGGNMALRANVFERVGLFDGEISGRGDETEWFHRARGLKLVQDPDLWAWHRRDEFNLLSLCRHSFVQGLAVPLYKKKIGEYYRPQPARVMRFFAHALRYRCAQGVALAHREIGAIVSYFRLAASGK